MKRAQQEVLFMVFVSHASAITLCREVKATHVKHARLATGSDGNGEKREMRGAK